MKGLGGKIKRNGSRFITLEQSTRRAAARERKLAARSFA